MSKPKTDMLGYQRESHQVREEIKHLKELTEKADIHLSKFKTPTDTDISDTMSNLNEINKGIKAVEKQIKELKKREYYEEYGGINGYGAQQQQFFEREGNNLKKLKKDYSQKNQNATHLFVKHQAKNAWKKISLFTVPGAIIAGIKQGTKASKNQQLSQKKSRTTKTIEKATLFTPQGLAYRASKETANVLTGGNPRKKMKK